MVKLTVNYDDSTTYHLYFGDELGHPGTIFTFFPWSGAPKGHKGTGQLTATTFAIPENALQFWDTRLNAHGITSVTSERFGENFLSFSDPDGQGLELVASENAKMETAWKQGPVPSDYAIRGFHSVTLSERELEPIESVLIDTLGFRLVEKAENRFRYEVGNGILGTIVDVLSSPKIARGFVSVGTVHHVAFRIPDDDQQEALRQEILKAGLNATPVIDRRYFHSVYFREPGGVLFEVATDPPGFTIDEPASELGTRLVLPPWLESSRERLERELPKVRLPASRASAINLS